MIEPLTAAGLGFLAGVGGGAFAAFLGWNSSGEPFEARKFTGAIATGIISGLVLVFANLTGFKEAQDEFAVIALLGTIFMGAMGADTVKEKVKLLVQNKKESTTTTTTTPTTPT